MDVCFLGRNKAKFRSQFLRASIQDPMDLASQNNEALPASNLASNSNLTWRAILAVCCAFALRYWFIRGGLVDNPMVGDALQYSDYAWNLAYNHTFSMAPPGEDNLVADSFRDPGYPLFLAILLRFLGSGDTWYHVVLLVQAVIGALSAGVTVLLSARWLGRNQALAAGLLVAGWPHNVAISGFMLSETLFGFAILLALWLLTWACQTPRPTRWVVTGLGFGMAAMVNSTMIPFGALLAWALRKRQLTPLRLVVALLAGSVILPGAWAIRGLTLQPGHTSGNRAVTNLVQGSWGDYHAAYVRGFLGDPQAKQLMSAIDDEVALASDSPVKWVPVAFVRFERNPLHYLAWYAWKPCLLWAWDIRMGMGDVYPYKVLHPIYSTQPAMGVFEFVCIVANPLIFALMVVAVFAVLGMPKCANRSAVLYAAALLVAYETLVYTVLQAEPRYSIPLRPLQMMLAVTAVARIWEWRRAVVKSRAGGGSVAARLSSTPD
jgi:hypothetical protein